MGTIGKVKLAALEAAGEDEIFGMITAGKNASDVIARKSRRWRQLRVLGRSGPNSRSSMAWSRWSTWA